MGCLEFYTVTYGEQRIIPLRATQSDNTPTDLTGVTEIVVRFKKKDGTALIKSMTSGAVTLVSAIGGRFSVTLTSEDTRSLKKGERQDFTAIIYRGTKATFSEPVGYSPSPVPLVFSATYPGIDGNVSFTFDGVKSIQDVLDEYNYNNPDQPIFISPSNQGSKIPPVNTVVTLTNGTDLGLRPVNYYRALTVEGLSV